MEFTKEECALLICGLSFCALTNDMNQSKRVEDLAHKIIDYFCNLFGNELDEKHKI